MHNINTSFLFTRRPSVAAGTTGPTKVYLSLKAYLLLKAYVLFKVHLLLLAAGVRLSQHSPPDIALDNRPNRRLRCRWQSLKPRYWLSGIVTFASISMFAGYTQAATVFINELHYDNSGSDIDEGIEIAGPSGTSLDNWQILFYNGLNGTVYRSENLHGTLSDQSNGFGALWFGIASIQNGPADAVALVDEHSNVWEFISYEGEVTATEGAASGLTSMDIGIAEATSQAIGASLQRNGTGTMSHQFYWSSDSNSLGQINANQLFTAVPLPPSALLFFTSCAGLFGGCGFFSRTVGKTINRTTRQILKSVHSG